MGSEKIYNLSEKEFWSFCFIGVCGGEGLPYEKVYDYDGNDDVAIT